MITSEKHQYAKELDRISEILDKHSIIYEIGSQDLREGVSKPGSGAEGMSAEEVVRAAITKQMNGYSYEELSFHLIDSICYRQFCRIGIGDKGFKKSALCSNIMRLSAETWEAINRVIIGEAEEQAIEKGREVRLDCTVVSSNIHEPTDSSLLWDCVRVIIGILIGARDQFEDMGIIFTDHRKRAKGSRKNNFHIFTSQLQAIFGRSSFAKSSK